MFSIYTLLMCFLSELFFLNIFTFVVKYVEQLSLFDYHY